MKRVQPPRGRTGQGKGAEIEWIGGVMPMPAYVTGEGAPYRPDVLCWMGADGVILGSSVVPPGRFSATASISLQQAMDAPMAGRPHRPTHVRVASPELADALRADHPDMVVVCAPTPELDALFAMMRERLADEDDIEHSLVSSEITPGALASFFAGAAALYRAKPWKVVPGDECLFAITIEALDVRDAVVSVVGQMGESFGFVLFRNYDEFEDYLDAGEAMRLGEEADVPPHFALNFERGADLAPSLRREVQARGWEVAGPKAYPMLFAVDEDLVAHAPSARDLAMVEAIARVLAQVVAEKKAVRAAFLRGEPLSRTLTVSTGPGEFDVTVRAPYSRTPSVFDPSRDLLGELAMLELDDHESQDDRFELENELLRRFTQSPEGAGLESLDFCMLVMDFSAHELGVTIATLRAPELDHIVFDFVPLHAYADPSQVGPAIEALRAFYAFLGREFGLEQADACLEVLGDDAVGKLMGALSERAKSTIRNSRPYLGAESDLGFGYRDTPESRVPSFDDDPWPASSESFSEPPPRTLSKEAIKAKKAKRKAASKARKKKR